MKTRTVFAGILFIGLGLYFLAGQLESPLFHFFQGWPALLAICGAALLGQAHSAREYAYLFPGFLLLGFGVELLLASAFSAWPRGVNMFFSSSRSLFSPAAANKKAGPALACFSCFSLSC